MDPVEQFTRESSERVAAYAGDSEFQRMSQDWLRTSMYKKYVYNFTSLGRPIIQYPQDMVAMQELIWSVRPDLIVETGIAHGGSLILSASMLAMLDMCDAIEGGTTLDPNKSKRKVLGIDIDIRAHNRKAIETHPMSSRIQLIQGSSIARETVEEVNKAAAGYKRVLVCLDSMHTQSRLERAERVREIGFGWLLLRGLRHFRRRHAEKVFRRPFLGCRKQSQDGGGGVSANAQRV